MAQRTFHVVSVTGCDNERADIKSRRLWGARRDSVFAGGKPSDPVKFTEDLLQSMANMLWTRLVSENGVQCLRMGEQMFMTLRAQGKPTNSQAAVWYEEGINKLVSRYDKCLNVQGDYVEK